ncbi:DUF2020 domain-containing protein [Amycolatopsis albispora]|uniref:DUF2020 domain-containing protein n=1 Tax=Amycolatopsis albispora TaxID=1804986 RepID=A0A344LDC3_9PSEU|nr:DUF2020 domain-containing protein [Amycolatopsis albispora]AXB46047.1 hypothetical protein A4R43_29170 [Amycolatopsis albispora]
MRSFVFAAAVSFGVLAGCSSPEAPAPPPVPAPPPSPVAPVAPAAPEPAADGKCPYLEETAVERANGQRVSKVRLSAEPPPTCFFYALNGKPQLTVRPYAGDPAVAKAVVDQAAPIATSNPADQPPGWQGGMQTTGEGAVYAVAKGGNAVVVTTNQGQTVKAREVAKQAIASLGW